MQWFICSGVLHQLHHEQKWVVCNLYLDVGMLVQKRPKRAKSHSVITASRPSITDGCYIACSRWLCEGCKELAARMHHSLECESSVMPNSVLYHTYLHSTMLDVPYVFREALLTSQHTFESTLLEIT